MRTNIIVKTLNHNTDLSLSAIKHYCDFGNKRSDGEQPVSWILTLGLDNQENINFLRRIILKLDYIDIFISFNVENTDIISSIIIDEMEITDVSLASILLYSPEKVLRESLGSVLENKNFFEREGFFTIGGNGLVHTKN